MKREIGQILDCFGCDLLNLTHRYEALDARNFVKDQAKDSVIDPVYTLGEQLYVEPQPRILPAQLKLDSPIQMSRPETAIALSHIDLWRKVATGDSEYTLILEDDVWFQTDFVSKLDQAWEEIKINCKGRPNFDIFYLSYEEVKYGAPKTFISNNVFRPVRGLWQMSGYVISRSGAKNLLQRLPCRGPVDLWINHQFEFLDVLAVKRSIINQRLDTNSTNSYSILPMLTKVGAITSEGASLFNVHPNKRPVFAFGPENSGLSSLAMALSMLGYRCCSDLQSLPVNELQLLLDGRTDRIFDAYVNVQPLEDNAKILTARYPQAKFIVTSNTVDDASIDSKIINNLDGIEILSLPVAAANKWHIVCEHLGCVPPTSSFPHLADIGQRPVVTEFGKHVIILDSKPGKRDKSPWIVESRKWWKGIHTAPIEVSNKEEDRLEILNSKHWLLRDDTFTGNLALFRPSNVDFNSNGTVALNIKKELLGVRDYSAASLTSRDRYNSGKFEAVIKASNVPGVVTGFFLHRDSPRQEIDIEIAGNKTDLLLVNVFYNPGDEGAKFDYGYRGTPSYIDLGFDASQSFHRYRIEWSPSEVCWFVDDRLVHRRVNWDPTPIPNLPMHLHINIWPSCSTELAGRLNSRRLPTAAYIKSITLDAKAIS